MEQLIRNFKEITRAHNEKFYGKEISDKLEQIEEQDKQIHRRILDYIGNKINLKILDTNCDEQNTHNFCNKGNRECAIGSGNCYILTKVLNFIKNNDADKIIEIFSKGKDINYIVSMFKEKIETII